jgi:glycosyltransferase involved in cell wall biosynthesis
VIRLAVGLGVRGHRVLLGVVPGDRFALKAREAGLELVSGIGLETGLAPLGVIRDVRRLGSVVQERGVDIIHSNHSHDHWLAWLVAGAGGGRRRPVVRTFHNRRAVKRDPLSRALYRRTAASFAVSRHIEACCRHAGIATDRVYWVPGSADVARFSGPADSAAIREEFKLGSAPVVVTVSRLAGNRGHELLLSGFRLLRRDMPDARLLLVGKGERRGHLEQLVTDLGLAEHVVFAGYRDRDLPAVLAAADCFALMAAGSDESCRAALEAMAAGRPVVGRRVGALPETVVHGETGLLVDDDRAESVAGALHLVLRDPGRAAAMGRAGRHRAMQEFGPDRSVDIVERVYRRLT